MSVNSINELAAAMEQMLNDKEFKGVFENARFKTASKKEEPNVLKNAYDQLVEASEILDELGFAKSAELTLYAVETLLSEAEDKKPQIPFGGVQPAQGDKPAEGEKPEGGEKPAEGEKPGDIQEKTQRLPAGDPTAKAKDITYDKSKSKGKQTVSSR